MNTRGLSHEKLRSWYLKGTRLFYKKETTSKKYDWYLKRTRAEGLY